MGRKPTLLRGWSRAVRVRPKGQGCPPLGVWGQPRESGAPSDLRHALPRPQGPPTHAQASPRPTYSTAALLGLADGMDGGPWTDSSRWPEAAGWANQLSGRSGRGGGPGTAGASPAPCQQDQALAEGRPPPREQSRCQVGHSEPGSIGSRPSASETRGPGVAAARKVAPLPSPVEAAGGPGEGSVEGEAAVGNTGSARAGRGACREASLSWSGKWGHCLPEGRGARRERMTMKRALGDRRPFWRPPPGHARALSFSRSSNMQPLSPTRRHRTSFHQ